MPVGTSMTRELRIPVFGVSRARSSAIVRLCPAETPFGKSFTQRKSVWTSPQFHMWRGEPEATPASAPPPDQPWPRGATRWECTINLASWLPWFGYFPPLRSFCYAGLAPPTSAEGCSAAADSTAGSDSSFCSGSNTSIPSSVWLKASPKASTKRMTNSKADSGVVRLLFSLGSNDLNRRSTFGGAD